MEYGGHNAIVLPIEFPGILGETKPTLISQYPTAVIYFWSSDPPGLVKQMNKYTQNYTSSKNAW